MLTRDGPAPRRFRRRLTVAFILVAAIAGGLLAVTSFVVIREYRHWTFRHNAEAKAKLTLVHVPAELTLGRFDELLAEYQQRAGFETVTLSGDLVFSSTPAFGRDDVPGQLRGQLPTGQLTTAETTIRGTDYLVVAGTRGSAELYFFFSRDAVAEGLTGVREILGIGWLVAVGAAAGFAHLIARRTLRPVRSAAAAGRSRAERLLDTRFDSTQPDEFAAWAESYDQLAEALEAKIAALEEAADRERRFTSDVAHDLRTPVTTMVTAAALLDDEIEMLPEGAQRPARLLIDDARRLHTLVLELLELARLDAGREQANVEPIAVAPALAAVVNAEDGHRPVTVDVEPEGLCVLADRTRFRRVVGNLVSNAVRHSGGEVVVRARLEGSSVAIDVLDRGPGIPEDHLGRIFDRFFKADTARSQGGSGLGLAIADQNARLQGGTLTAGNRPGGGARFTLRLPAAARVDEQQAAHPLP